MKQWFVVGGVVVILLGAGYLFFERWSDIREEQKNIEQTRLENEKRADEVRQTQQAKREAEQAALEAADAAILTNVRVVDELVKRYYAKAGYVPAMPGDLSLIQQGIFTDPYPGEKETRIQGVRYVWRGGNAYELCTDFKTSALPQGVSSEWKHGLGNHCFQRSLGSSAVEEIQKSL